MRVGVIRGDLPGPVFLSDLEPTSQSNFPVDPVTQTRYISRPNATAITNFLAGVYSSDTPDGAPAITIPIPAGKFGAGGVPAGIEGTAVSFSVTIVSSGSPNNVLRVKNTSTGSFVAATIANGVYATMTTLLAAVNAALKTAGVGVTATQDSTGTLLVLQSTVPGVGSYIGLDTNGNGSTANATLGFSTSGANFTMPSATAIITALNPVQVPPATGAIDVRAATITSTLGAAPAAQNIANLIAPQFNETDVAQKSFAIGNLAGFLRSSFNPNPRLIPLPAYGPAIQVVQNDGHTAYTFAFPEITGAVHNTPNAGDITITGVGLGVTEYFDSTKVIVTGVSPGPGLKAPSVTLSQKLINHTLTGGTQGSVTPTSIVIPASLLLVNPPGHPFPAVPASAGTALGVAGSTVELRFTTLANTVYGAAATLSSFDGTYVTVTGLTNMTSAAVGSQLTINGSEYPTRNNGSFLVTSYISSSSVKILNPNALLPDTSSGSLVWSLSAPIAFTVT
jgi:hypothetical protein